MTLRRSALLLLLLLASHAAGCLDPPVDLVVANKMAAPVSGVVEIYADGAPGEPGVGGELLGTLPFRLEPREEKNLGRLPPQEEGYERLVVRTDDGRAGEGAVIPASHASPARVEIRDDGIFVIPQSVR